MVFVGNIPFNQPNQNEQYVLLLLGQEVVEKEETIQSFIDLRNIFPRWLVEKGETTPPTTHIITFTQSYYDWLYNFGGYRLFALPFHSIAISELLDIDETPDDFLKHFIYTYASGFPDWYIGATEADEGSEGDDDVGQQPPPTPSGKLPDDINTAGNVRTFIKNIRQSFYQRKSTEDAYRYFFSSLFGANQETLFYYPKTDIFRLNGGRFGGNYVYGHFGDSRLNYPQRIQDSYWFQEYSYVVKGHIPYTDPETGLPIYFEALHEMLHPAGMKGFWEKTEDDYIPPDDFDGGFNFCESPKLENYFGYRMNDDATLRFCAGCSGSGHTYDGPTAMFFGISESGLGGLTGWTSGSAWNSIGAGGICIEGTRNSPQPNPSTNPTLATGTIAFNNDSPSAYDSSSATGTIQFNSSTNADYDGDTFTVTSTDGTEVVYTLDDDTNTNTYSANATNIGIQGVFGAPSKIADLTTAAGNHSSNAHYGKITFVETGGVATVTLTQSAPGANGNNTITTSDSTDITVTGFADGRNDETFTVKSTDGTEVVYTLDDDSDTNTYGASTTNIGIQGGPNKAWIAGRVDDAITNSSNAHYGKITTTKSDYTLTLTQVNGGVAGNNTIATSDSTDITVSGFTDGSDGILGLGDIPDAWGGITLSGQGQGNTYGAPTHFYPHWALGICGDADHSIPFNKIYIREFIELCPLEDSPNLGLTGCTANSYLSHLC